MSHIDAVNKYNAKKYDSLRIVVPKGRKRDIERYLADNGTGESINGLVNRLIRTEIGLSDDEWKRQVD